MQSIIQFASSLCLLVVAACAAPEPQSGGGDARSPAPPPPPSAPLPTANWNFASSGVPAFDSWRTGFATRALSQGRSRAVIVSVLDGLTPLDQQVQTASFEQAEFVKPIWDYAKSAVSPTRITNGQRRLQDNKEVFDAIETSYATPREIVTAIWGMESSYGGFIGNIDGMRALATLAYTGRRKELGETELLAAMRLIEDGVAERAQFARASWAGAVGQTQFMPSTFLAHARDFDRDGKKDLWGNAGDALASAANYLTVSGWRKGEPWAVEARLPDGFDYSLGDGRKQSVAKWKEAGLTPATAAAFAPSDQTSAELFLPAGSYGPAFLLFDNFGVIKRYNNADSYALAVGLLADRLAGRPDLSRPWPTDIKMLTKDEVIELQTRLNALGHNAGGADGIIGRNTRAALQRFQKAQGLVADGFPTVQMLDALRKVAS